ncbi:MAG TPA: universal stress protein [Polyangiaceae bacterium]|jgi:nucleotide-binding universal stress UspA family protein
MAIPFRRILVPIDFTEVSTHALDWAIELAASVGASITVLHSYAIPVVGFPDGALIPTPQIATSMADAARKALDAAVAARRGGPVELDTLLREGEAWEAIVTAADEIDADLIVVGTHGRHGLARALLGSVAEHVVRTSHRPVLTLSAATPPKSK